MKSILIIVPYQDIYPPLNGGMQRCFHIIHQLAKNFNLTAIIHQDKESFLKSEGEYPAVNNIKIHSTKEEPSAKDVFSLLPRKVENALRYRWAKRQLRSSADGMFIEYYPILIKLLKQNKYDSIILENLNTINAVSIIRKYDKVVKIIYDAHNIDTNLCTNTAHKAGIQKAESNLYKIVDALFSCSEIDRTGFLKMNNNKLPIAVIPNGVNVGTLFDEGVKQNEPEYILFCGALWTHPNSEGLFWFYKQIWPDVKKAFPNVKLLVVGSGQLPNEYLPMINAASLVFTGSVDNVGPWYNKAAVAIVPLLSGSGTRLKILEAMSYGLPVISTTKGAEGIEYRNNENIVIADTEQDFSEYLIALLQNKDRRLKIQKSARKLIEEKYDWNVVGNSMSYFLKNK
jgi:glycosyltransferase involved in cell wall biosynthesis